MRRLPLISIIFLAFTSGIIILDTSPSLDRKIDDKRPNDWFFLQRAFPYNEINYDARNQAWAKAQLDVEENSSGGKGIGWEFKGPLNIGGRISAVAMHHGNMQTIYAGAASGGIFKSINGGTSWTAVFDAALSLSIGDIAIAPSNPSILYAGTGESNAGGGSMTYDGYGIYKSSNAGFTWQQIGLENCGSVGRIIVHPEDPDIAYVAAMGRLFSNNTERGIYKTTDGGNTWEKVLYLSDSTGAIDIVMHPQHPDTLYAAMWERVRRPDRRDYGGQSSGIYRSYDGGDTWTELTGGLPYTSANVGRIGIDISESDPDILYAIYADDVGYFDGVYKSTNGGTNWVRTNDGDLSDVYSSYGWWFGRISIDPVDPDIAYVIGFDLYKTSDGGDSWSYISGSVHVDQHDIIAHSLNHNYLVLGNDGGIYISNNGGNLWTFLENMPITQFYTCEVDELHPERLYGGTQDNGTNRTMTGGLSDWQNIYWGDGFYVLVEPGNPIYVYAEYQYGQFARSTDGGNSFYTAMTGIGGSDRMNWNTPVVFSPTNPQTLYYGSNKLYRSTNRAVSWQAISPDLTNNSGGFGGVVYGTITTIAGAASNNQYIYVGTDDGNVWRTSNGGSSWTKISTGLPERWVTRVAVDPYDEEIVYVTLSGYKYDSYIPHVFRSSNAGDDWQDISANLPEAPVNDIIIDPGLDSVLYLADDFGVYISWNLGQEWEMLGGNLPNVPIVDLDFHGPTRMLIAATYGRSMYTFNVDQLVGTGDNLQTGTHPVEISPNPAHEYLYIHYNPLTSQPGFTIATISGSLLIKGKLNGQDVQSKISLTSLLPGFYILNVIDGNYRSSQKFLHL